MKPHWFLGANGEQAQRPALKDSLGVSLEKDWSSFRTCLWRSSWRTRFIQADWTWEGLRGVMKESARAQMWEASETRSCTCCQRGFCKMFVKHRFQVSWLMKANFNGYCLMGLLFIKCCPCLIPGSCLSGHVSVKHMVSHRCFMFSLVANCWFSKATFVSLAIMKIRRKCNNQTNKTSAVFIPRMVWIFDRVVCLLCSHTGPVYKATGRVMWQKHWRRLLRGRTTTAELFCVVRRTDFPRQLWSTVSFLLAVCRSLGFLAGSTGYCTSHTSCTAHRALTRTLWRR